MNKLFLFLALTFCTYFYPQSDSKELYSFEDRLDEKYDLAYGDSVIGQNIDRYLSAMETLGFSGAITVIKGDKVVLRKGYGLADRYTRRLYTSNTIQSSGSITKQFTAAAILLLESRSKLSVNDSISQYFEQVSEAQQGITIHQLLTHSSGLPGGIGPDDEPIGDQSYIDRLRTESLQFNPGTGYAYSNTGYSLLAMIIEQVTGQNYEDFLREELLLPAGMKDTGYILPDWDRDRMAIGYRNGEHWGEVYQRGWIEDGPNWHLRGNGGMHTTVGDMAKWLKTVQGCGVLAEDIVNRWTTGYVTESNGYSEYGYGWVVYEHHRWGKVITHSGSNRIFEADFVWLPEKDLFFYIQGNTSIFPAASERSNIMKAAFDSSFVMPPVVGMDQSANPETAQKRTGKYYLNAGYLEVTADDTRLVAKLTDQSVLDLMFDHSDEHKNKFAELNARTRIAMMKLQSGEEDALIGLNHEDEDAAASTAPFLRRMNQIGNLDSLHVIGTFANTPGSRFHESGPWTTFVYAEFENWNQYWNLIWDEDGTYKENRSGPWPTFVLIPTGENQYKGVLQGQPWNTVKLDFKNECLIVQKLYACLRE